jgi:hypothetical protein
MSDALDDVLYKTMSLQAGSIVVMLLYSELFCFYEQIPPKCNHSVSKLCNEM